MTYPDHTVKHLIFDLDGTLIDSTPGIAASLIAAFLSIGREMPKAELRHLIGPPIRVIAQHLDPSLSENDISIVEREYRAEYDADGWRKTVLFDGVAETLKAMHSRKQDLFIVTNKPRIPTEKILSHFGLFNIFEEILTRDTSNVAPQTKVGMVADLLGRHGRKPGEWVMIGDTNEDKEAANSNGLQFIHARYGYGVLAAENNSIENFSELTTLLSSKNA